MTITPECTCPVTDPDERAARYTTLLGIEPHAATCPRSGVAEVRTFTREAVIEWIAPDEDEFRAHLLETWDAANGFIVSEPRRAGKSAMRALAARLAEVTAERDALAASVARVRGLHVMHPDDCKCLERMFGGKCFHHGGCEACRCKFPCSTLASLDGSGS